MIASSGGPHALFFNRTHRKFTFWANQKIIVVYHRLGYRPIPRRNPMIDRRVFIGTLGAFSLAMAVFPVAFGASKSFAASSPLAALDKDHDGSLDLAEVKDAASAAFDRFEKDHDATLDRKEVGGHMATGEFKEADPDNDATLTKDEYLALAEKLFNEADADKNGTLSAKELHSKAGRSLVRLIR
jgi:EF hand